MTFETVQVRNHFISDVFAIIAVEVTPMANVKLSWRENLTKVKPWVDYKGLFLFRG